MTDTRQEQDADDGERGVTGLAVSIVERKNGKACLVFDDIHRVGSTAPFQWNAQWFFTRLEFELEDLVETRLDDRDLASIGLAVVARLAAHHKTSRSSRG
jgi:hypothetical protein